MCVICFKPKNAKFPDESTIKAMWEANSDGAGFMFPYNGKVRIVKGLMKYSEFIEKLNECKETYGTTIPYVLHFRIGTSGGNIPANTHPFPVTADYVMMRKEKIDSEYGVAMNGIISCDIDRGVSDTMTYIKSTLSHIAKLIPKWHRNKEVMEMIYEQTYCKWSIMNGNGDVRLIGGFVKSGDEDDDCMYSNLNWAWRKTYSKGWANNWNHGYGWDEDYDEYENPFGKAETTKYVSMRYLHEVKVSDDEYLVINDDFFSPESAKKYLFACDSTGQAYKWSDTIGAYIKIKDAYVLNGRNVYSSDRILSGFFQEGYGTLEPVDYEFSYEFEGEFILSGNKNTTTTIEKEGEIE